MTLNFKKEGLKLSASLLKAQMEIGAAVKDSTNPYFKSKYADLGAVIASCKEALNKHGISILQPVEGDRVVTMLVHESGEYMCDAGTPIICTKQNDPQAQGSAITYARRYGLSSLLLIPTADDDGEGASNHDDPAGLGSIDAAIKKCVQLQEKNHDPKLLEVISGLNQARLGKRSMTRKEVEVIKERATELLKKYENN